MVYCLLATYSVLYAHLYLTLVSGEANGTFSHARGVEEEKQSQETTIKI